MSPSRSHTGLIASNSQTNQSHQTPCGSNITNGKGIQSQQGEQYNAPHNSTPIPPTVPTIRHTSTTSNSNPLTTNTSNSSKNKFVCPFGTECKIHSKQNKPNISFDKFTSLKHHIERHTRRGDSIPQSFFDKHGGSVCTFCSNYYKNIENHKKCKPKANPKARRSNNTANTFALKIPAPSISDPTQNIPPVHTRGVIVVESDDESEDSAFQSTSSKTLHSAFQSTLSNTSNDQSNDNPKDRDSNNESDSKDSELQDTPKDSMDIDTKAFVDPETEDHKIDSNHAIHTSLINDYEYSDSIVIDSKLSVYHCPVPDCTDHIHCDDYDRCKQFWVHGRVSRVIEVIKFVGWKNKRDLHKHINDKHCRIGDITRIPHIYFTRYNKELCSVCSMCCKSNSGGHPSCLKRRSNMMEPPNTIVDWESISCDEILSAKPKLLYNCPKPCINLYTAALTKLLNRIAYNKDIESFKLYFAFTKMVLLAPNGRKGKNARKKDCNIRIRLFNEGKYDTLWGEREQIAANRKRAISYVRDSDLSGAAAALTSEGMAPLNNNIKQQMMRKHPDQEIPECIQNECAATEPIQLDVDLVWNILKKLKYNSGAGPSMLRPRHVKSCAKSSIGFAFAEAFTKAANALLNGSIDKNLGKYAASGSLYPLWKDKAKGDARPIVSGDILTRVTGRAAMRLRRAEWKTIFEPEQ
eukprot:534508_1